MSSERMMQERQPSPLRLASADQADFHGGNRGGLSSAMNVSPPVQRLKFLGAQLAASAGSSAAVVQRVLQNGGDFKLSMLGAAAEDNLLNVWGGGQFISAGEEGNEDVERNDVHVHIYGVTTEEDAVTVNGHAIWNKKGGRNQQQFTLVATLNKRWTSTIAFADPEIAVANKNPDLKATLFSNVVDKLPEILSEALNA